nr:Putative uncharacterized protein precursor [uncultured bacterium]
MKRWGNSIKLVLWYGIFALAEQTSWAEWHVWVAASSQRVLRDGASQNIKSIDLAAARNEWRSFQILMRSDEPVKGIELKPGRFGEADHPVADLGLYRQHQLEITTPTTRNSAFTPGWYPDPLIPLNHPLTGQRLQGAALVAQPFDLPANQTHGFWVDVYVKPDAQAGEYQTEFALTAPGEESKTVSARLKVWDFALPQTPSMQTSFGSPAGRMKSWYANHVKVGKDAPIKDWTAVEEQCAQLLAEHRINATPPDELLEPQKQGDGTWRISEEKLNALGQFIDRYHVNALDVSKNFIFGIIKDPDAARDEIRTRLKAFEMAAKQLNRPNLLFYVYLTDEPNDPEAYDYVRKWGKAIKEANSVVKVMITEQSTPQKTEWGDLYGAVDIWCPLFPLFEQGNAARRQALGETVWAYTALCQRNPTPWWHIDYPLLNYRVPAWISWRYRIRGLLYWGGMSFWNETGDPWRDAWTYGHKKSMLVYNGEGTLVYPGRKAGYDGIAPSLRLKALRDGIEDYEYLTILERKGLAEEAQKIVLPLAESWFKWQTDPAAYDRARAQLAKLIMKK